MVRSGSRDGVGETYTALQTGANCLGEEALSTLTSGDEAGQ